jgi:hypothetical protein
MRGLMGLACTRCDWQEREKDSITIILAFASRLMAVLFRWMGRSPKQVPASAIG